MQWRAYVRGNPSELTILRQAFTEGDVVVEQDDGEWWLAGAALIDLPDAQHAYETAKGLLPLINGVGRVLEPLFVPIALNGQVAGDGASRTVFAEVQLSGRGRLSKGLEPAVAARVITRAANDRLYDEVIGLLGNSVDLDWIVLYKAFELLRDDAGGEKAFLQRSGVTKGQLSAFTGSANNRSVSGWEARHAVDQSSMPPRRTMGLDEARCFVLAIVRDW